MQQQTTNTVLMTEKQRNRNTRNLQIIERFHSMSGSKMEIIRIVAMEFNLSVMAIRDILKKNGVIGRL